MLFPLNLTGGTYKHKSLPLSAQQTINFWPQVQTNPGAKSSYILESFPGLVLFSAGGNRNRGMFAHKSVVYQVSGTELVSINSSGVRTVLGIIPGRGRCIFDAMVDSIIVVTGGKVYEWNGTTLTEGDPADFETPNAVTVLNNQAIYDGDGSRFCVSDVGTPLTINGLNYAAAESKADELVRPYAFNEVVRMFGTQTIEGWWNSGSGQPPFDRLEGGIINVGLKALESVASNDKNTYFLGSDSQVYVMTGGDVVAISPQPITRQIDLFTDAADAIGWCMHWQGQQFYVITFITDDKTFIYPEGGEWFQLSSGVLGGKYIGQGHAFCYEKHLITDANSNIYYLSDSAYSENGAVIQRTRDSAPIHGGVFGQPGKSIEMNSLSLVMETGSSTIYTADSFQVLSSTGASFTVTRYVLNSDETSFAVLQDVINSNGEEFKLFSFIERAPLVMMSFSDDGGKTWSEQMYGDIGTMGQFNMEVRWDGLGSFDSRVIRIQTSDPVYYSIYSAAVDIEVGI